MLSERRSECRGMCVCGDGRKSCTVMKTEMWKNAIRASAWKGHKSCDNLPLALPRSSFWLKATQQKHGLLKKVAFLYFQAFGLPVRKSGDCESSPSRSHWPVSHAGPNTAFMTTPSFPRPSSKPPEIFLGFNFYFTLLFTVNLEVYFI